MSTINTGLSGGYYQLNYASGNSAGNTKNNAANPVSSLLQANAGTQAANNNLAYFLDLSPEAQKYMSEGSARNSVSALYGASQSFTLSSKQRQEISEVIAKYKDAPFTQETYNQIQDDLKAKGLSGQQLSMIDKATSFNPTQVLVGALTGKPTADSDPSGKNAQAKIDNFMSQILSQWKEMSSTVDEALEEQANASAVAPVGGASGG
jgi:hypothetical protein